jgi:uncharacterized protein
MHNSAKNVALSYLAIFAGTHVVTIGYGLSGRSWLGLDTFVVANGIMLIPGLVALALARWFFRQPLNATLGLTLRPNRWWLVAWLLPPLLMLAVLGVSLLLPGTSFDATMSGLGERLAFSAEDAARLRAQAAFLGLAPPVGLMAQGLLLGPTVCLVGALGEELAWRGLFHNQLAGVGFWRCSLVTGVLWGMWHVPMTLQGYGYPHHPVAGTFVMMGYVLAFAPILTFLRIRAGSVLAPAIFHGTANGTVLVTLAFVRGGGDLLTGWGSISCMLVLATVDMVLALGLARGARIGATRATSPAPGP